MICFEIFWNGFFEYFCTGFFHGCKAGSLVSPQIFSTSTSQHPLRGPFYGGLLLTNQIDHLQTKPWEFIKSPVSLVNLDLLKNPREKKKKTIIPKKTQKRKAQMSPSEHPNIPQRGSVTWKATSPCCKARLLVVTRNAQKGAPKPSKTPKKKRQKPAKTVKNHEKTSKIVFLALKKDLRTRVLGRDDNLCFFPLDLWGALVASYVLLYNIR